jgi:hypothetical protein
MAQPDKTQSNLRQVLHSAYTAVRSRAVTESIAGLTLDHLMKEQVASIDKGSVRIIVDAKGDDNKRISKLDALNTLEQQLNDVVQSIVNAGTDPTKLIAVGVYEADTITNATDKSTDDQARSDLVEKLKRGL